MLIFILITLAAAICGQITPVPREITPVPRRNPREKEFQNIDSDGNGKVTFTEFLLSDKSYIEHMSKNFHNFDDNGDSQITKEEFDGFYAKLEEERQHEEKNRENFFNHFGRQSPFSSPFFDFPIFHQLSQTPSNSNETGYPDIAPLLFA